MLASGTPPPYPHRLLLNEALGGGGRVCSFYMAFYSCLLLHSVRPFRVRHSTVSVMMDTSDNQNKHHHKHSKHSKHSHSKRKHKHHHHHHHHHHHSKKKHHKHKSKVKLDERALLSALECLEADALDSIRVEVSFTLPQPLQRETYMYMY